MTQEAIDNLILTWVENPDATPESIRGLVARYVAERDRFHALERDLANRRQQLVQLERSLIVQEGAANVLADILRGLAKSHMEAQDDS